MKEVTAAIMIREGRVLVAQRAATDPLALKWEFPGGKIEDGETPEECLVREIKEELGLTVEVTKHCMNTVYRYAAGEIELLAYFAEIVAGEMRCYVHNDVKWVPIGSINKLDFAPADRPIVERLIQESNQYID